MHHIYIFNISGFALIGINSFLYHLQFIVFAKNRIFSIKKG